MNHRRYIYDMHILAAIKYFTAMTEAEINYMATAVYRNTKMVQGVIHALRPKEYGHNCTEIKTNNSFSSIEIVLFNTTFHFCLL